MDAEAIAFYPPNPLAVRGSSFVLGGDPKKKYLLYGSGKGTVLRDLENPIKSEIYPEHKQKVTVAKISPSGYYVCSGDVAGNVRVWPLQVNEDGERILKLESRPFAGEVRDLNWGPESKRLGICGDGSSIKAACISWDSGNSLGKLVSHIKRANSIDLKPNRPYRLVVCDDDYQTVFYEGPPFKQKEVISDHTRFANAVRYSPDGKYFATASSDCHVYLYDGKTSEKLGEFVDVKGTAHGGGIYGLAWNPNSKELLSVSGDKTAKLWDVETKQLLIKFSLGNDVLDQQYSCIWIGDNIITLSLSGNLNFLDRGNPEKPLKIVYGHSVSVTSIVSLTADKPCHVTGDNSGKMLWWDTESGTAHPFKGKGHTNIIVDMRFDPETNKIISAAWDDTLRFTCSSSFDFESSTVVQLGSQPKSISLAGKYVVVNTNKAIVLVKDGKVVSQKVHDFEPDVIAAHGNQVAVPQKRHQIKIFNIENDSLVDSGIEIPNSSEVCSMMYSPDGSYLAFATDDKGVRIYSVADSYSTKVMEYHKHIQKPTILAWSADSQQIFSSGMDARLGMADVASKKAVSKERVHPRSYIQAMTSASPGQVLTAGNDLTVKLWKITC